MQVKSKDWQEFGGWAREAEHGEPLWQYWRKEGIWMESMTMGVGMSGSGDFFFKRKFTNFMQRGSRGKEAGEVQILQHEQTGVSTNCREFRAWGR